jgi:hypothetical protein
MRNELFIYMPGGQRAEGIHPLQEDSFMISKLVNNIINY